MKKNRWTWIALVVVSLLIIGAVASTDAAYEKVFARIKILRDAVIGRDLAVTGNTTLTGTTAMTGNATAAGTFGITGNTTVGGTLGVTGIVTHTVAPITAADIGDTVAAKCGVVEYGNGIIHRTVVTFTLTGANDLDLADGDHGTGIKIYDFPAGSIEILAATCNGLVTSVNAEGGGATFPMALGSAVGADDNTLTSTEADIIPSTAVAGGSANDFHATLAAPILFANAAGTDLDLYANAAITAAVATDAVTIALTGTATITWINGGDY